MLRRRIESTALTLIPERRPATYRRFTRSYGRFLRCSIAETTALLRAVLNEVCEKISKYETGARRFQTAGCHEVIRLARIPDRLGQHGVELTFAEFLRLLRPYCLRELLGHGSGTRGQHGPWFREWPYLRFCRRQLVSALQAQTR